MLERCLRCDGKGKVIYKTGYPGQDHRALPYADIKWRPSVTKRCPVCKGLKRIQKVEHIPRPPRTEIYWNTPLTDEEKAALFTTEVPPDYVYEEELRDN